MYVYHYIQENTSEYRIYPNVFALFARIPIMNYQQLFILISKKFSSTRFIFYYHY